MWGCCAPHFRSTWPRQNRCQLHKFAASLRFGGAEAAPLVLLASLGLTTTLVHEKKHEEQHRGKNDRRASQDIKVVRSHEKHTAQTTARTYRDLARLNPHVEGSLQTQRRTEGVPSAGLHAERPHELAAERPIARGPGSPPYEARERIT